MSLNQTVENVYLRQDAVQKTRKHFWRLLWMTLVISVCVWLLDACLTSIGDYITGPETQAVVNAMTNYAMSENITTTAPVSDAIMGLVTSPKFWIFNFVYIIITGLVNSGLGLGRHAQLLGVAAWDEKPKALGGFSRMRQCVKAWLLTLWTSIKVGLWAFPGIILIFADTYLWEGASSNWLAAIGIGLVLGLTIPAALRYCLATFILADEPYRGVRECVTFSKGLMAGHKWQCFKLGVPAVLKMLGVTYGVAILLSIVVVLIGSTASTAVQIVMMIVMLLAICLPLIYFCFQFDLAYALFYLKRRAPAEDASTSYWLRDHNDAAPASTAPVENPDAPAESYEDSPEDTSPETNEEKENNHE